MAKEGQPCLRLCRACGASFCHEHGSRDVGSAAMLMAMVMATTTNRTVVTGMALETLATTIIMRMMSMMTTTMVVGRAMELIAMGRTIMPTMTATRTVMRRQR